MDENSKIKQTCDTCIYFEKHYALIGCAYMETNGCGECIKGDLTEEDWKETVFWKKNCKHWEPNSELPKEEKRPHQVFIV